MMWSVTKVTTEEDWFERYVRLALSCVPPSLPAKRQRLGATSIQWFETEPGVAFIDARGGSSEDRLLAVRYMRAMLAGHGYRQAQYEIDYGMHKEAKWGDIMAKAKRLVQQGKVQINRNGAEDIVGTVVGDHGTYNTHIQRQDPSSRSITLWQCDCPWDQYAWQRTRQWKKYEGRPCAHVLATYWKSMVTPVDEDVHPQMTIPGMGGQNFQQPAFQQRGFPQAPGGLNAPMGQPMAPQPMTPGPQPIQPMLPGMAPPGQAIGTPPVPGMPPEILPPFPMEGQLEPQELPPPQVSIPGAKPQSPLNPVQWPGATFSSTGWDTQVFSASPFNVQPEGFQNGNMVQLVGTDMGVAEGRDVTNPLHGQYLDIRSNTKGIGEVLGMDTIPGLGEVVEVIFPLDKTGELEPYHIRAWLRPDQLRLRPDVQRPGPMIKRRK